MAVRHSDMINQQKRRGHSKWKTYFGPCCGTEARTAIEPVVVAELVDLDAPPVGRLMRHGLCHHQRLLLPGVCGNAPVVREEVGGDVEVLLER